MYLPKHFQLNEKKAQLKFIDEFSFGTLVTCFDSKLEINQLPFIVDEKADCLIAHMARSNSHWHNIEKVKDLKVCFTGPDAYISPNWYTEPSKNVPTWNYLSVQVSGKASVLNDKELIELLDKLSQKHEAQFENPWKIDKLSNEQLKAMTKAIVGIKISIDSITGKAKLSQNKAKKEKQGVLAGLSKQSDADSRAILQWMKK